MTRWFGKILYHDKEREGEFYDLTDAHCLFQSLPCHACVAVSVAEKKLRICQYPYPFSDVNSWFSMLSKDRFVGLTLNDRHVIFTTLHFAVFS